MRRIPVHSVVLASMVCALSCGFAEAQTAPRGGYAVGAETCGEAPFAFPRLRIGLRNGYCAGLVAGAGDGLQFPRSIVQIPGHNLFVVADMGGWSPVEGPPAAARSVASAGPPDQGPARPRRLSVRAGDRQRQAGSTAPPRKRSSGSIRSRPNPHAPSKPSCRGLPARDIRLPDGTRIGESAHLMKAFLFDAAGRLYVNVGAPTDACVAKGTTAKGCAAGEGPAPLAAIWAFTPPPGGVFPALKPGDANPPMQIFARGLRNSMALAVHPRFPADGFAFLQAENARDLPDPTSPNEELNAIEQGRHYGWPYCYDLATASPEFKAFLQASPAYKDFCNNTAAYRQPHSLLPPHSAPLAMFYYRGSRFPELDGKLVVGLHGYRPTGSRVIFYDVDARGFPAVSPAPVRYNVSCAAEPTESVPDRAGAAGAGGGLHRTRLAVAQGERRAAAGRSGRHDGGRRRRDLAGRGQERDRHPDRRCAGHADRGTALRRPHRPADRPARSPTSARTTPTGGACGRCGPNSSRSTASAAIRTSISARSNATTSGTTPCCGSRCRRTAGSIPAIRTPDGCGRGSAPLRQHLTPQGDHREGVGDEHAAHVRLAVQVR